MTDEVLQDLKTAAIGHSHSPALLEVSREVIIFLLTERERLRKEVEEQSQIIHDLKEDNQAYAVTIKHYSAYEPIHGIYTSSSLFDVKMWTQKEFDEYNLKFGHSMFAEVYCGEEVILIGERVEDELIWRTPNQPAEGNPWKSTS